MDYYYSPEQVADKLQVHIRTVYRWIRDGRLKAIKLGPRMWRIPESELRRFLRAEEPPSEPTS